MSTQTESVDNGDAGISEDTTADARGEEQADTASPEDPAVAEQGDADTGQSASGDSEPSLTPEPATEAPTAAGQAGSDTEAEPTSTVAPTESATSEPTTTSTPDPTTTATPPTDPTATVTPPTEPTPATAVAPDATATPTAEPTPTAIGAESEPGIVATEIGAASPDGPLVLDLAGAEAATAVQWHQVRSGTGEVPAEGELVAVEYVMHSVDTGELVESTEGEPLAVIIGAGFVPDAFDAALLESRVGARFILGFPEDMPDLPGYFEPGAYTLLVDIVSFDAAG